MEVVNARAIYSFTPFIVKNKAFNIKRGGEGTRKIGWILWEPDFISFLMIKYNYVYVVGFSLEYKKGQQQEFNCLQGQRGLVFLPG